MQSASLVDIFKGDFIGVSALLVNLPNANWPVFHLRPSAKIDMASPEPPASARPASSLEDGRSTLELSAVAFPESAFIILTLHQAQGCTRLVLQPATLVVLTGCYSPHVHSWNYSQNWPYVVLSRVRTRRGLFSVKHLPLQRESTTSRRGSLL
jgi:hypothetical protein